MLIIAILLCCKPVVHQQLVVCCTNALTLMPPPADAGKKYVAEYVDDRPTCGSVLEINDDEFEPPATQDLADSITRATVQLELAGHTPAPIPPLQLLQPSKV